MEINNNISSTIPLVDIVLVFCYVFSFYVIYIKKNGDIVCF